MLTSPRNPLIQHIRRLQSRARARREAGEFVIEGIRLIEEALQAGVRPRTLIHTPDVGARGETLLAGLRALGVDPLPVSPSVMQAASDTPTPQGVLAVLPIRPLPLPPAPGLVLVLDQVRDPGNLGAILRTAAAAGVEAALLAPHTADPYAPKVVRAGMGAHFRIPIHPLPWDDIRQYTRGLHPFLADARAQLDYTAARYDRPLALIIGSEATGPSAEANALSPTRVRIPMPGGTESLNVAVAAGILLFEILRQRK